MQRKSDEEEKLFHYLKTLPSFEYDYCRLFVDDTKLQIIKFNCDSTGMQLSAAVGNLLEGMSADVHFLVLNYMRIFTVLI